MTGQRMSPRGLWVPGGVEGKYVLDVDADGLVTGSRRLIAGDGVDFDDSVDGELTVSSTATGSGPREVVFKYSGTLATGVGATRLYNDTGAAWTLVSIRASVETAPSGGSEVIDVNVNGTTVFTTQANRPTITTGNVTSGKVTTMDVTTVADGDYLTVDIDTHTSPAANLTVTVVLS